MGNYGIEELKDMVRLGAAVGRCSWKAGKDGWQWTDYLHFLPVVPRISPALEGAEMVPVEFADLDVDEVMELARVARDEFGIGDDDVNEFIDNSLQVTKLVLRNIEIGKKWWV